MHRNHLVHDLPPLPWSASSEHNNDGEKEDNGDEQHQRCLAWCLEHGIVERHPGIHPPDVAVLVALIAPSHGLDDGIATLDLHRALDFGCHDNDDDGDRRVTALYVGAEGLENYGLGVWDLLARLEGLTELSMPERRGSFDGLCQNLWRFPSLASITVVSAFSFGQNPLASLRRHLRNPPQPQEHRGGIRPLLGNLESLRLSAYPLDEPDLETFLFEVLPMLPNLAVFCVGSNRVRTFRRMAERARASAGRGFRSRLRTLDLGACNHDPYDPANDGARDLLLRDNGGETEAVRVLLETLLPDLFCLRRTWISLDTKQLGIAYQGARACPLAAALVHPLHRNFARHAVHELLPCAAITRPPKPAGRNEGWSLWPRVLASPKLGPDGIYHVLHRVPDLHSRNARVCRSSSRIPRTTTKAVGTSRAQRPWGVLGHRGYVSFLVAIVESIVQVFVQVFVEFHSSSARNK